MPEYNINRPIPFAIIIAGKNRKIVKLKLSDEWSIECVLDRNNMITSIEIHRKNTDREFSVSGELTITKKGYPDLQKEFSVFIEPGSPFTEIWSDLYLSAFYPNCLIKGLVKISDINEKQLTSISDISEKQPTSLANEESREKIQLTSLEKLSNDFQRLLLPESYCIADVTLKCNGVSIPAHKTILCARSPVFASMFANPMKESRKNEVDISDIDESVLRALLMYMYTGKTSNLTFSSAASLLFAADKYQLQDLKTVCSYFLKNTMSLQNVWEVLALGEMHSEDLKTLAVEYISNNCGEFSVLQKTQEWKALRKERPDLAMDLLESLMKYRDEKVKQ